MVSAWWLLVALWAGGCIGFLLATVLAMSEDSSRETAEDPGSEPDGRLIHGRH